MKKIAFLVFLLAVCQAAARAQESRQDISLSGTALIEPFKASSTDVQVHSNTAYGGLLSYRFMVTPTSALELNYGITYQNSLTYYGPQFQRGIPILTRTQEISGAFVKSFVFKNFNPFIEAGPAAVIYLPIYNSGTKTLDAHQQTQIGAMYGAGIAYEVSPSFDIRVEYRGIVSKVPTFGVNESSYNFTTNRWWNMSVPAVGVAYHF
ncbi:MAG: outer membrane beta-barrel protein [Terracidiphilus sp.]|jgi:opacity protein-like surface antigen